MNYCSCCCLSSDSSSEHCFLHHVRMTLIGQF